MAYMLGRGHPAQGSSALNMSFVRSGRIPLRAVLAGAHLALVLPAAFVGCLGSGDDNAVPAPSIPTDAGDGGDAKAGDATSDAQHEASVSDAAIDAPVEALHAALDQANIPRGRFVALKPGQVFEF